MPRTATRESGGSRAWEIAEYTVRPDDINGVVRAESSAEGSGNANLPSTTTRSASPPKALTPTTV